MDRKLPPQPATPSPNRVRHSGDPVACRELLHPIIDALAGKIFDDGFLPRRRLPDLMNLIRPRDAWR